MTAPDPVVLERRVGPAPREAQKAGRPAAAAAPPPPRRVLAVVRQLERAWPVYMVAILLALILL